VAVPSGPGSVTVSRATPDLVDRSSTGGAGAVVHTVFITVGLVEAAFFINLAFIPLFVFATPTG